MPLFKAFTENGKLVKLSQERLDETNLQAYRDIYGEARTAGYLEAIADFIRIMNKESSWGASRMLRITQEEYHKQKEFLARPEVRAIYDMEKEAVTPQQP